MAVKLNSEKIDIFLAARRRLHLTQLELSIKAKIALRTIKDIESGRRSSFNESTLISLCRALELDYNILFGALKPKNAKKTSMILVSAVLLIIASLFVIYKFKQKSDNIITRTDWVAPHDKLTVNHWNPVWNDTIHININYYHLKQTLRRGEKTQVSLKFSYNFIGKGTPLYYINAFTQWNPDAEIRIYKGVLSGEGSNIFNFKIKAPKKNGFYKIRVFFASAFGAVSSFYGSPLPNQLSAPGTAPYIEIPIEVIR